MNEQYEFDFTRLVERQRSGKPMVWRPRRKEPAEFKVMVLRDYPLPENLMLLDTPEKVVQYWNLYVPRADWFNQMAECCVVVAVNTRRKAIGHFLVATGTLDSIFVHPREVFRTAILLSASAIVLTHNHPSGDSTPSDADIKVTRDLIRAGQLLKIEVLDHVIIGRGQSASLRELGFFYA